MAGRSNALIRGMKGDPDSIVEYGSSGHPCAFLALGVKSLQRLRYSEYMFARKFDSNASLPLYVETVLAQ